MGEANTLENLLSDSTSSDLRLSASRVSSFIQNGPSILEKRKKISNEGIKMGKLIDLLLFEKERFKDEYVINDFKKPTASLGVVADNVLNSLSAEKITAALDIVDEEVIDVKSYFLDTLLHASKGLWVRTTDPAKRLEKILTSEFVTYVYNTALSEGKEVITVVEKDNADLTVNALRTHSHTKHLFDTDLENHYQFEVTFNYRGFDFLAYLDMVQVDHKNKTIAIKDLKTGAKNESQFLSSVLAFNYYIQAKLYQIAATKVMELLQIEGYTVLPFDFVYISRYDKLPAIYTFTEKWEEAALNGFTTNRGIYFPGLDETVDLIKWHWDNKVFNCSKLTYESNGHKQLSDNFINVDDE